MPDDALTPLGELLEHAREHVLHLSARQAAIRAGISGTRWRQIVTGVAWRDGQPTPVKSTPRTIVAMALAVDVDPAAALQAGGLDVTPASVEALVREASEPRPQPAGGMAAGEPTLADEIDRVRALPIGPEEKIRIVQALIGMWAEKGARKRAS